MVCGVDFFGTEVTPIQARDASNKKLAFKLLGMVVAALLFAYTLVPLYNVLCKVTGLNGKTENSPDALSKAKMDSSRWVTVGFTTNVMAGLGWTFYPRQPSVRVHPGQIETVLFVARNITNQAITGQAVPSLSPGQVSPYFKKIECFCFQRQELKAGESKDMPLRFYISPDLPEDVHEVTLSYAFYNAVGPAK